MYLDDCVCVLPDLTWLPLLGVGRKSWYIIIKYCHIIFIIIVFYLVSDRLPGLLFFRAHVTSFDTLVSLLTFLCLFSYFILALPMRECLWKHSYISSTVPIAMLNSTCFFPTVQLQVRDVCSEQKSRNS